MVTLETADSISTKPHSIIAIPAVPVVQSVLWEYDYNKPAWYMYMYLSNSRRSVVQTNTGGISWTSTVDTSTVSY